MQTRPRGGDRPQTVATDPGKSRHTKRSTAAVFLSLTTDTHTGTGRGPFHSRAKQAEKPTRPSGGARPHPDTRSASGITLSRDAVGAPRLLGHHTILAGLVRRTWQRALRLLLPSQQARRVSAVPSRPRRPRPHGLRHVASTACPPRPCRRRAGPPRPRRPPRRCAPAHSHLVGTPLCACLLYTSPSPRDS